MYRKSIILFLLKCLKIPLTIAILYLTANYFGVSLETDVWLLSSMIIGIVGLALWGPINETFRAKFIQIREIESEKIAINYTKSLIFYMCIVSLIITLIIFAYPNFLVNMIAPSFSGSEVEKLFKMIRFLAPIFIFIQINLILSAILNAYEIFYITEISSIFTQLINIIIIVLFSDDFGIWSLVFAYYVSVICLSVFLVNRILTLKIEIFKGPIVKNFKGFKIFFMFSIPFFIPYLIGQLNGAVEKVVATSIGVGSVSIIDYGRKIPDLLNGVLVSIVLTILVPTLTKAFVNNEEESFKNDFLVSYRLGLFGIILFICFFINAVEPICNFLYKSPSISIDELNNIITLNLLFSICLVAIFSYIIFGMCLLSSNKAKFYVIFGSFAQIMVMILNFLFVEKLRLNVFPFSIFTAHFFAAFFMFLYYPFGKISIIKSTIKYYFFGLISVILSSFFYKQTFNILYGEFSNLFLVQILYSLIISIIIVYLFGFLFKVKEVNFSILFLKNLFVNWRG